MRMVSTTLVANELLNTNVVSSLLSALHRLQTYYANYLAKNCLKCSRDIVGK
jgi:hypothetical protein